MDWSLSLGIALTIMLCLFFMGVPVFVTFLVINIVGVLLLMGTSGFGLFANSIYQSVTSHSLSAVPLFLLMGEILFRSGTIDTMIDAGDKLIGRLKGRNYVLISGLSIVFGALCGAAVAVAALLGRTIFTTMTRRGYNIRLSAGAILGGATLAAIIPPSAVVVILGSQVDVSIAVLLIAGIGPGVFLAGLILFYTLVRIFLNPKLEPEEAGQDVQAVDWKEKGLAFVRILPFTVVIFFVMGLMLLGVATPSESAATGVLGALAAAAFYRKLSWEMINQSLESTVKITAIIIVILFSSKLFSQLLSYIGATTGLVKTVAGLDVSAGMIFLALMVVPFFLCMFIDGFAVMMVTIPIYQPIIKAYGFDPVWFWMLFLINLALGSMTPPFGYTLFALKGAAPDISIQDIYMGAWPIVFVFILGLVILYFLPGIVTFIPGLM